MNTVIPSRDTNSYHSKRSKGSAGASKGSKGGKGSKGSKDRFTRAGNSIDAFPFDMLSTDGAKLAQSIISPLGNPISRTRDPPLNIDDSTLSTVGSSDEDVSLKGSIPGKEQKANSYKSGSLPSVMASVDSDSYYEAPPSQEIHRVTSPPPKTSNSITYSTKFVRDPNYEYSQSTAKQLDTTEPIEESHSSTSPSSDTTSVQSDASTPIHNQSRRSLSKKTDPDGSRITSTGSSDYDDQSDSYNSNNDSFYEVYDSPRVGDSRYDKDSIRETDGFESAMGSLSLAKLSEDSEDNYTMGSLSLAKLSEDSEDNNTEDPDSRWGAKSSQNKFQPITPTRQHSVRSVDSKGTFSNHPLSPTIRSRRVAPDGSVHISPSYQKREMMTTEMVTNPMQHGNPHSIEMLTQYGPIDPDGQGLDSDENISIIGEDMLPTPNDMNEEMSGSFEYARSSSGHRTSQPSTATPNASSTNAFNAESESEESEVEDSESNEDIEFDEEAPSSTSTKVEPKADPFPSNRMLVLLAILVVLAVGGLVGGLTWQLWEKKNLDPIRPPDLPPDSQPNLPTLIDPDDEDTKTFLMPTDEELLNLFESAIGPAAKLDYTSAGKAAQWMINEDLGKTLKARSNQGWIQRYLLAYTYHATTEFGSTAWLSCNPPKDDEEESSDECKFTYPTELPGGRIIYDLVPSHRWLSAADECQWGGVACGKTVTDEVNVSKTAGTGIADKSTLNRLAVTSIVLADQYLSGAIVTELTQLPELKVLDLSHNGLKGTLSEDFRSLETLRLQYNVIEGQIPSNFFDDESVMNELNVGNNKMDGKIPSQVGLASKITDLYLYDNNFSGTIPVLGDMPLINFQVQQNQLTGIMPFDYSFGGTWADTLREWWVFENQLTGSLSENLGFLTSLEDFRVNENKLTGKIPESIANLQRMFRFDVQKNSLTGTVPESIGQLPVLRDVHLQFNAIKGVIPTALCFLESMEVLEGDCLMPQWPDNKPQTDCYCCTACCNPDIGICDYY